MRGCLTVAKVAAPAALMLMSWGFGSVAVGQGASLIPIGGEAKAYAGAGQLTSRSAMSLPYNPANLDRARGQELQYDVSILDVSYDYTYPGYQKVPIKKTTPVLVLGYASPVARNYYVGAFLLPKPQSSQDFELSGLPARKIGTTPIVVDVKQMGKGFGYLGGIGGAVAIGRDFTLGLSLAVGREGYRREATSEGLLGIKLRLLESEVESTSQQLRFGARYEAGNGLAFGGSLVAWARRRTEGYERTLLSLGDSDDNLDATDSGPVALAAAAEWRSGSYGIALDLSYTRWADTEDKEKADLFNTLDYVAIGRYALSSTQELNLSYGYYPSPQGDGLIAAKSPTGAEVSGFEVGNVDEIGRQVVGAGYAFVAGGQRYLSYLNLQRGNRAVFEDGVAYGQHRLQAVQLGISGSYGF